MVAAITGQPYTLVGGTRFSVLGNGNVGIGTTTPNRALEVNGSIRMGALITGAGGAVAMYRDTNGDLADSMSSIRYKTNVAEMDPVMSRIMALKTVRFNWNNETSTPGMADFGMISEEVNFVLPELVTYEADGTTPHGLKYEKMGLFALKGLQEQQGQIDTLTARLDALTGQGVMTKDAVEVNGKTTFDVLVSFAKTVSFGAKVTFLDDVEFGKNMNIIGDVAFLGRPTFNKDTAGRAVIKKGMKQVDIVFEKEYADVPVVNASLAVAEKDSMDILGAGYSFVVSEQTTKGFSIVLNKKAVTSVSFSWVALAIKDATTTTSPDAPTEEPVNPAPAEAPAPANPPVDNNNSGDSGSNPPPVTEPVVPPVVEPIVPPIVPPVEEPVVPPVVEPIVPPVEPPAEEPALPPADNPPDGIITP